MKKTKIFKYPFLYKGKIPYRLFEGRKFILINGIERELKSRDTDVSWLEQEILNTIVSFNRSLKASEIPVKIEAKLYKDKNKFKHISESEKNRIKNAVKKINELSKKAVEHYDKDINDNGISGFKLFG